MNATCDALGLTVESCECPVEAKTPRSLPAYLGHLLLAIFSSTVQLSVTDEQVLSLP